MTSITYITHKIIIGNFPKEKFNRFLQTLRFFGNCKRRIFFPFFFLFTSITKMLALPARVSFITWWPILTFPAICGIALGISRTQIQGNKHKYIHFKSI